MLEILASCVFICCSSFDCSACSFPTSSASADSCFSRVLTLSSIFAVSGMLLVLRSFVVPAICGSCVVVVGGCSWTEGWSLDKRWRVLGGCWGEMAFSTSGL